MNFASKTRLAQHISEMVKSGYLIPEWKVEYVEKNGKPMTKGTKMFKVNFSKFNTTVETNGENKK